VQVQKGFPNTVEPGDHALAGEKVCIQATTPMHASELFASMQARRICAAFVRTGFQVMGTPDLRTGVQQRHDLPRLQVNLAERRLSVELLAPGEEPAFEVVSGQRSPPTDRQGDSGVTALDRRVRRTRPTDAPPGVFEASDPEAVNDDGDEQNEATTID